MPKKNRIKEHNLMQYINSKHILGAKEVYSFNEKIVIVMKWMPGQSLTKYLSKYHK